MGSKHCSYHIFAPNNDPGALWGPRFNVKEGLDKNTAGLVVDNAPPDLSDANVALNQTGGHACSREPVAYLKRKGNTGGRRNPIRPVLTKASQKDDPFQLADYVAVVSTKAASRREDGVEFRSTYLLGRERNRRIWPKQKPTPSLLARSP